MSAATAASCPPLAVRAIHGTVLPRPTARRLVAGRAFVVKRGDLYLGGSDRTRAVLGEGRYRVVCRGRHPALLVTEGAMRIFRSNRPVVLTPEGVVAPARFSTVRIRRRARARETLIDADQGGVRVAAQDRALVARAPADLAIDHGAAPRHDTDPFAPSPAQRPVRASDRLPSLWADGRACSAGCRPRGAIPGWPLTPFHTQHPIRAGLNELRPGSSHEGIDIVAFNGQRVYAIQPGRVHILARSGVDERLQVGSYIYWHVAIAVREGEVVRPYRTVLGTVFPNFLHVHLSEKEGGRFVDPLRPGGRVLAPYRDTAPPVIGAPYEDRFGRVDVEAFDPPSFRVREPFHSTVVAVAGLAWRDGGGPLHFAYRGTQLLPFSQRSGVFAPGAHSASFGCFYRFAVCRPRWRMVLAGGLAPRLARGRHRLTIYAWDRSGNRAARPATVLVR